AAPYIVLSEPIGTWGKQYPNKEVLNKMAESSCSVMSNNNINTQNQVSAVQRINQTEDSDKTEKVMELMLLEDYRYGEIPRVITNLMEYFENNKLAPDKNDILVGFIYILMLESGFVHKDCTEIVEDCDFNYKRLLRLSKSLPEGWKRHHSYRLDFILKSTPQFVCNITCMTASDDLLVNCVIKDVNSFSVLLDPLMYFTSSTFRIGSFTCQNLDHLSRAFKNAIAFPAKIFIAVENGGICACLQDLPHELLLKIMSYLKIEDVMNLAKTNRSVCRSAQDASLWTKLLDYDFRKKRIYKTYEELKFLYEIKYARELAKILNKGP
ncbi:F-box-like domain containing protein, partial [Asbolus verrucosus]